MVTGELGFLVKRGRELFIKYDRPGIEKPFKENEWNLCKSASFYPKSALIRIAFEADRHLLRLLGYHSQASKEWLDLTEGQRKRWIEAGPRKPVRRARLFAAIMFALEDMAEWQSSRES